MASQIRRCTVLLFFAWFSTAALAATGSKEENVASKASALLISRGAICSETVLAYVCQTADGLIAGYPERVTFVIPKNLKAIRRYHLHLHGHLVGSTTYDRTLAFFNFAGIFPSVTTDSILLLPESAGFCTSYRDYFSVPGNSVRLLSSIGSLLSPHKPEALNVHLSGHSGAYRAMKMILADLPAGWVSTVSLFDATYGDVSPFRNWALEKPDRALLIACVKDSITCQNSQGIEFQNGNRIPNISRLELTQSATRECCDGYPEFCSDTESAEHFCVAKRCIARFWSEQTNCE
jgi:hypothetical protein